MYLRMYIYIHIHMYIYYHIHVYIHIYIHRYTHIYIEREREREQARQPPALWYPSAWGGTERAREFSGPRPMPWRKADAPQTGRGGGGGGAEEKASRASSL